jgi:hypothetical protein
LLPDGDLAVISANEEGDNESRRIARYSWEGQLVWERELLAHHHLKLTPRRQLAALTLRRRRAVEVHPSVDIRDNEIVLLSAQGELLGRCSLYDVCSASPEILPLQRVARMRDKEENFIDLFHANSVRWMHDPQLAARHPLYSLNNVVVCSRHQDAVIIIDWENKSLVWAWGQGEISGPHDATVLENGHILLFDNGLGRKWSRVIELDPLTEKIVWEYKAAEPSDFFTYSRGSCQRLPNGNTLITESGDGEAFEVTPQGEIIWKFLNPSSNEEGQRGVIPRMTRYGADYVQPHL